MGGETLIGAAAKSDDLAAIVSEGASGRSIRDDLANPGGSWDELLGDGIGTAATALFTSDLPPLDLNGLVPEISGATFFVYGEHGQSAERPANRAFYRAARGPKELWEVPGSGHTGGFDARPHEYERRVVGFFDRYLRGSPVRSNARRDPRESRRASAGSLRQAARFAEPKDPGRR